ncbi:hypothetical protein [Bradyrhizobium sp. RP6]|uniref:hypothetical protein n=1 Tax=Bradyrhizobium sp. RP6 TaxID=2489596 RepID=UPI000F53C0DA|nr:hypothetical protein [Bradyrhizobium sp. RP6]RQH12681.1 hypothetical protein EHH60_14410 [Bradyrhizobium sp. RP6]
MKTSKSPHQRMETLERWSAGATLGILVGILIEIGVLWRYEYHPDQAKFWLSILANILIGLGLTVEYFCIRWTIIASKEAEAENDAKLAAALNRAASAEEELFAFRTTRRHVIGPQQAQLTNLMRPFAGAVFDTAMSHFEREIGDILWDIEAALDAAGWQQIDWAAPAYASAIRRNLRPISGSALAQNVEIEIDPSQRQSLLPAADALIRALNQIGIDAREAPYTSVNGNPHAIHVMVGPKR